MPLDLRGDAEDEEEEEEEEGWVEEVGSVKPSHWPRRVIIWEDTRDVREDSGKSVWYVDCGGCRNYGYGKR